ncbi:cytochrome P450 [Nonomuraea diastatica]|uniref:Cytochrome P450 n=1 Tax=Nonomuraea diastatica TaxID=1848329 RepID=A0A4V2YEC7_9ACTN|nr:cytochrome P450 [Nonomuraea diastatica]TDD18716.1 cytochrome P450 [Nonomuraea diastatica]
MTETDAVVLPTERPAPLDPPTELAELRETRSIARLAYADGHLGWLVTSHALVREVMADPRFSVRPELRHRPIELPGQPDPQPAQPGMFLGMDPPGHTRYRRLLTGEFTVRRMGLLAERIEEITRGCLDAMERQGGPVDLVEAFAEPIPAAVIGELLGVPEQEFKQAQEHFVKIIRREGTAEDMLAAYKATLALIQELIGAKRAAPTDDVLSGLTRSDLTDEELANIGFLLLGAGLDTTANMLALGTFALLDRPGQIPALLSAPDQAVEELLRYLSITPFLIRTALEDVELGGELVRAGETVTLSIAAANRDPDRFPAPDALDLSRSGSTHLGFGHGVHQCLGQQLARVELRVALPALFTRFPSLRLAVAPGQVPVRPIEMLIHGLLSLPVTWGQEDPRDRSR